MYSRTPEAAEDIGPIRWSYSTIKLVSLLDLPTEADFHEMNIHPPDQYYLEYKIPGGAVCALYPTFFSNKNSYL